MRPLYQRYTFTLTFLVMWLLALAVCTALWGIH